MNEEDKFYINWENAVKLKDKGFPQTYCDLDEAFDFDEEGEKYRITFLERPQHWLREEKGVIVYVEPTVDQGKQLYWGKILYKGHQYNAKLCGSWEEAIQEGISRALDLI